GHAVGKVILRCIAGEILQRQYGQRADGRGRDPPSIGQLASHAFGPFVVDYRDVAKETIASARNGFDEAGVLGGVTQSVANFADRLVETVIEVNGRRWP